MAAPREATEGPPGGRLARPGPPRLWGHRLPASGSGPRKRRKATREAARSPLTPPRISRAYPVPRRRATATRRSPPVRAAASGYRRWLDQNATRRIRRRAAGYAPARRSLRSLRTPPCPGGATAQPTACYGARASDWRAGRATAGGSGRGGKAGPRPGGSTPGCSRLGMVLARPFVTKARCWGEAHERFRWSGIQVRRTRGSVWLFVR